MKSLIICLLLSFVINAQLETFRVSPVSLNDPEEVTITINPVDPSVLAVGANIDYCFISTDYGRNWSTQSLNSQLGVWGDPSLVFDAEGDLYFGHLSNPVSGYWIDRIVVQKSTDNGTSWNNGAGIGYTAPKNQDKEWLAVDHSNSVYRNNIYTCWTEFDEYGSNGSTDSSRILFSKSEDRGITWTEPILVSDVPGNCIDSDNTTEGAVPAVGPDGEIYTAWSGPLGIMFDRSLDGGASFGEDIFITDQPGGWDFDIPGIDRCNGMPITACDISNSIFRGNVYVLWSDQRNGTTDTDIFFKRSTDKGLTWEETVRVNDDNSGRHQFFPWMCVDSTTGIIYAVFYDRRNTTGSNTDVYMAKSTDGGQTFENIQVSQSTFNPSSAIFFGDYIGIAAHNRKVYPVWTRMDNFNLSVWCAEYIDTSIVLPVEFNSFSARLEGMDVLLNWSTATELNNYEFIVERKNITAENKWISIVNIPGAGTSTEELFYSYSDKIKTPGTYIYRIKQTDYDGAFDYSKELRVEAGNDLKFNLMQNYPNPFNPVTTISFQTQEAGYVKLSVCNALGAEVEVLHQGNLDPGNHEFNFDGANYVSGMYVYKLTCDNRSTAKKMILLK